MKTTRAPWSPTAQRSAAGKTAQLLNGRFHAMTHAETVRQIIALARSGTGGRVLTANVAVLMAMRADPFLQRFAEDSTLVVADGQPLVWYSRLAGTPLPERVAGADLVDSVCAAAVDADIAVHLLGADPATIARAGEALRARYPGLQLGVSDGYFDPADAQARAAAVRDSGARILFVGMGVPRQEHFIAEQSEALRGVVCIGVGGTFDVLAGARTRAPRWAQDAGLEWLFRLVQEPRRLARRYATTNAAFIALGARELLGRRLRRRR